MDNFSKCDRLFHLCSHLIEIKIQEPTVDFPHTFVDFPHTFGVGKITNNEGLRPELFGVGKITNNEGRSCLFP